MNPITIEATQYTPAIRLDPSGAWLIAGKSYPENTFEFYKPVMHWIEVYLAQTDSADITLDMEIVYFNSSSSKLFYDLFDLLDAKRSTHKITIRWLYDPQNESALEAGEDFIADFEFLNIQLTEK
ncbi:MAG: DUF1987 domain-containing protein [Campylobacterales bacterium]|nr:DUF1987 domain-containing protein [Campylobacterales bacterium]